LQTKLISHIFKGCFIAVIYIIFNFIIDIAKLHNATWTDFAAWIIIVGGALTSVHFFDKLSTDNQTFSTLFSHGFKTTAVATCLIFIYVLLMVYIINPNIITEKVMALVEQSKKNGNAIDEKILQQNIANATKIMKLMQTAGTVMLTLFLGIIGSLLGAVSTPKKIQQTI
jgi:Protein of unknown function (DUF4199)